MYTDDTAVIALRDAAGSRTVFSIFDPDMQVPYTIQSMVSVQHSLGRTMAAEVGYLRTDGNDFPLQRQFTQAFDRETGVRPNPALGAPGGYYVDSSQTMVYNGLQTSLRKRFSNRYSWDVNYTFGKSESTQGGDLSAYYIASASKTIRTSGIPNSIAGRPATTPASVNASFIYELPHREGIERSGAGRSPIVRRSAKPAHHAAVGSMSQRRAWRLADFRHRPGAIGECAIVTQPSGINRSRPDVVEGVDLIVADWQDTCTAAGCNYLNTAGFVRCQPAPTTNATLRPGTYMHRYGARPGRA